MTTAKGYRRYSPEFKREALKRASEDGNTDKALCANWVLVPDNSQGGVMSSDFWAMMLFSGKVKTLMTR